MRPLEIESLAEFDERVVGHSDIRGWHLQSIDLTNRAGILAGLNVSRAIFLGCTFGPGSEHDIRRRGGLIFPNVPDVPFNPYRASLYTPTELYAGLEQGYEHTPDAINYAWTCSGRSCGSLDKTLAEALHDHSIDDALEEWTRGRTIVGVMGGHAARRGSDGYLSAARLGHSLGSAFTVATGGGPGAMEAANLGALLAGQDAAEVVTAADELSAVPGFSENVTNWARAAFSIRQRFGAGADSLGIPTWFYGHEPPNVFASVQAKYFRNALREDTLLRLCRGGLVFLPGSAGTVQEIFQAACENFYASADQIVPMVLLGKDYWTQQLPAWQLLQALGRDHGFGALLKLLDRPEDVLPFLLEEGSGGR